MFGLDAFRGERRETTVGGVPGVQGAAESIAKRMMIATAVVTVLGGLLLVAGVLLGSRHELSERGFDPDRLSTAGQLGVGMMVIDSRKAVAFVVTFIVCIVLAVGIIGWHYSRKEVTPLQRALRLQRDFIADASHELKTPLAVLSARIDLLEFRQTHGRSIDDALADLRGDVDRMNAIITDLLEAASGAVEGGTVHLANVVSQSIDAVLPLASRDGVRIISRINGDPSDFAVRGGATGLSRCLVAVLDNAIAHSPTGGEVTVSLGYGHRGDAVIRVSDHGTGIDGDPERLFRRFARDDNGTTHQGYGLGLALARDVTERYGGSLEVESTSPCGTTMRLSLPLLFAEV